MSDFSQLCPLFSTGVYSEVSFYNVGFSGLSTTHNGLVGALIAGTQPGSFKFERSVVVTKIYLQKQSDGSETPIILAHKRVGTGTAAGTTFASLKVSTTVTKYPLGRVRAMTTTSKTFAAADVLGFALKTSKTDAGRYNFIVRYKEK